MLNPSLIEIRLANLAAAIVSIEVGGQNELKTILRWKTDIQMKRKTALN